MTPLHLAVIASAIIAGVAALRSPRRHLPTAVLCFTTAFLDVAREVLAVVVLRPERVRLLAEVGGDESRRAPFSGAVRLLYSAVEVPGYLAGPSALTVALAAVVCGPPSPRARAAFLTVVALVWPTAAALLAVAYPTLPPPAWQAYLQRAYAAWHLACALAAGVLWAAWAFRRHRPTPPVIAVLALACAELLVVGSGPYAPWGAQGVWTAGRWELARWIYTAAFIATAVAFLRVDHLPRAEGPRGDR